MAWLSPSRIAQIDEEITRTYERTGLKRYPDTPLTEIVKKCGLKVFKYDFGPDSRQVMGAIDFRGKKPVIYLNRYNHPNNQKFTLAHELGHYLLGHQSGNVQFRIDFESDIYPKSPEIRQQELEANYFAGAILMPKDLITAKLGRSDMDEPVQDKDIEKLATYFRVSESAVRTRISWILRSVSSSGNRPTSAKPPKN